MEPVRYLLHMAQRPNSSTSLTFQCQPMQQLPATLSSGHPHISTQTHPILHTPRYCSRSYNFGIAQYRERGLHGRPPANQRAKPDDLGQGRKLQALHSVSVVPSRNVIPPSAVPAVRPSAHALPSPRFFIHSSRRHARGPELAFHAPSGMWGLR